MRSRRWSARVLPVYMLLLALSGLAAGAADTDGEDAPAAALPSGYWLRPLAGQGEAPQAWSEIERSLAPEACRECHAEQYGEWRTSAHAGAFSPGLVGQLLTFNATQTAMCMNCHAPLSEQKQAFEAARSRGEAHLPVAQELAAAGNSCAGCHVRSQRRFGPPERDTGRIGPSDAEAPHGGVLRTADFESSEFCSSCHQFPQAWAVNGKPLQNTYVEWRASPQAAQGITCQSCHMPDRKHLWRGIHDPAMVTSGLTARFDTNSQTARFTLTNSGIGHAFPTYVTPKVTMHGVALDATGEPRPETAASHDIQRVVAFTGGRWVESSDTRLLPGESATVEVPWGDGERVRMWLEVHPDDYYDHQVYDPLLANSPPASQAARLITEADTLARASRYRLFETELPRPD